MTKRIAIGFLMIALCAGSMSGQGVGRSRLLTFEGTLLKYSPHSGIHCGVLYIHQVAKYRVDKIVAGKYDSDEIVVDQPACNGDAFKNILVGSHVKLTVRVWRKYLVTTMYQGIREDEHPKIFYVAAGPPMKIEPPVNSTGCPTKPCS